MTRQPESAESWSLSQVREIFRAAGCSRLYAKLLAPNDDSKKQIYLGGDLSALSLLPFETPRHSDDSKSHAQFAAVKLSWLLNDRSLAPAPSAKLIVYPDYPEVRLSGFLRGSDGAPLKGLRPYAGKQFPKRVLLLGVRPDDQIVGLVTLDNALLHEQIATLPPSEHRGVFRVINLLAEATTRSLLVSRLAEVHRTGWMRAVRLSRGTIVPCRGPNCGGYTLEAALGISANGRSEPDFLGWEVKQHAVRNFQSPPTSVLTLFTPEPKGGLYVQKGVETFVRTYGYPDRNGRDDRLNFGGIHRCGIKHPLTKLTLQCTGFDIGRSSISDFNGGIELQDESGSVAARWSFSDLLDHWKRKHSAAAYVPSLVRASDAFEYCFGANITLCEGTDFVLFLKAIALGHVYYDPGIKVENASSSRPQIKRRSQFRTRFADLPSLYHRIDSVDLSLDQMRADA
jgi:hypothetical protein